MVSVSDDVHHRTEEISARSHRGRRMLSRDFLHRVQQTKVQGNPPAVSSATNLRIPSTRLFKRNEMYASIKRANVLNRRNECRKLSRHYLLLLGWLEEREREEVQEPPLNKGRRLG
ncbi:unnamed protein product [Protopolystoma xenopodis]|uniref:Uncharacterized protein n=1 Tax=Protopolystoma xenopodis TaxID=117903 RepID=A0A3S5CTY7_9PLAT|nr:unnamed protein product [Protopolystoma xenopodis]